MTGRLDLSDFTEVFEFVPETLPQARIRQHDRSTDRAVIEVAFREDL